MLCIAIIRLSDNLLPGAFKVSSALTSLLTATSVLLSSASAYWLSSILRAEVLVIFYGCDWPFGMHRHLPSRLTWLK